MADLWVRVVTAALACCADSLPRSSTEQDKPAPSPQEASPHQHQLRSPNSPVCSARDS